jgi:hypothetical protein
MSITTLLNLEAREHAMGELSNYRRKLAEIVSADIEKTKADLNAVIDHFTTEVARIEALVPPRVLAFLADGAPPQIAVQMADSGTLTNAETAANILSQQALDQQAINQQALNQQGQPAV